MNEDFTLSRRAFCAAAASVALMTSAARAEDSFKLNYLLASSMYGKLPVEDVLAQVAKTGSTAIDIWREQHANQREQIEKLGDDAFAELLKKHKIPLGATTIWGKPFADELRWVKKQGGQMLVTGFVPKTEPKKFVEQLKPQLAVAEETGITVVFENHGVEFDAIRAFAEAATSPQLKIALAPYHLPQDAKAIGKLIEDIAPKLGLFYAWQHGMGAMKKLPKEQEMLQMPGRGDLDFTPIVAALKKVKYAGWTEIFMHPVPRGIPILETADAVTVEINRSRDYLAECLKKA